MISPQSQQICIQAFAGGPLSKNIGDELISKGVPLYPWYGGTEFGPPTNVFDIDDSTSPSPMAKAWEDWDWLSFSSLVNCRWIPEGDGTYELQLLVCYRIIKSAEIDTEAMQNCPTHRPNVENLEDTKGYATSDLWEPHPSKPGLWRVYVAWSAPCAFSTDKSPRAVAVVRTMFWYLDPVSTSSVHSLPDAPDFVY